MFIGRSSAPRMTREQRICHGQNACRELSQDMNLGRAAAVRSSRNGSISAAVPLVQVSAKGRKQVAGSRSEKSLARFERIAVVLSGCGALGTYQAGALAAMEQSGQQPSWL